MEELALFIMTFFIVLIIFLLIAYVVNGILYMKLAKRANLPHPWLAWVPYGTGFLSAQIGGLDTYWGVAPIVLSLLVQGDGLIPFLALIGLLIWFIYIDGQVLQAFGRDKNLSFLHLIPGIGSIIVLVILFGIAFGEDKYLLE